MRLTVTNLTSLPLLFLLTACRGHRAEPGDGVHFTLMTPEQTNIRFDNHVTESDSVNFYTNEYMYIGSGVGIGDFNRDGLPDIFFCGSQVSSRLYLNQGHFQFKDITGPAGVGTSVWCTGVSVVDINNDGWPDIYVCVSHAHDPEKRKNLLFINQGNDARGVPVFKEEAAEYGLADTGYHTQAVFFDYDKDGDLDVYLLNHRLYNPRPNDIVPRDTSGHSPAEDRLYRNEGIPPGMDHPVFRDVTMEAGIRDDGYGLGVVVTDLNRDGWPDIYVANDYIENDELWLNNHDGTFHNVIAQSIRHQSYNSMGVDAADINNDGWPDLAVLDMMPEINERKKIMYAGASPERYDMERRVGYEPSFTRNMLQLSNGVRPFGRGDVRSTAEAGGIPFFSEIGQLAGISETDWSWSVLMADFNNDGWKDMYITNGLARDLTNNDFLSYWRSFYQRGYSFGGRKDERGLSSGQVREIREELDKYGSVRVNNYFFLNGGHLRFQDITASSGLGAPSISQGCAYVDLDNDGRLDLVVNNMNQEAFIWRNDSRPAHFLTVELHGAPQNRAGIGARVTLSAGGQQQYLEQSPVRGYASTVDDRLHFGLGKDSVIDSLCIVWPDDRSQVLRHVAADRMITLDHKDAAAPSSFPAPAEPPLNPDRNLHFEEAGRDLGIGYRHRERPYFDFGYQRMLPQKYSQLGPPIATADVNGDGLMDFFVGGAAGQQGALFIQQKDGRFVARDLCGGQGCDPALKEDLGAVFFDANGDGHPDLLLTGGSTEFGSHSPNNRPRLFINDGKGFFRPDEQAIPADISVIAQAVAIGDLNGDGEPDIFIGGRVMPGQYPLSPRSYILENHHGVFRDVTHQVCPALENPGMITAAVWTDFDGDGAPDLVLCGEWTALRFFKNVKGKLEEVTKMTGLGDDLGLWRSLQAVDVNHDGKIDLVAGNMGWNNGFHLSADRPLTFFAKDMDGNGIIDLVPAYYIKNAAGDYKLYPDLDRTQLADEVPVVKKKYLRHQDFAAVDMEQLKHDFGEEGWVDMQCTTASSVWLENRGNGRFVMHELPLEAQLAPVGAILARDLDGDGNVDLVLGGNEYQAAPGRGRYDASYGLVLKGDGKGSWTPVRPASDGLILDGDVKDIKMVSTGKGQRLILAAINDDSLRCFRIK